MNMINPLNWLNNQTTQWQYVQDKSKVTNFVGKMKMYINKLDLKNLDKRNEDVGKN